MIDSCVCPTAYPLFLYVGRAVKLRNRLQRHAFGSVTTHVSRWIEEFQEHGHLVYACAWYVPKNELGIAEATLLDLLHPVRNYRDFNCTPSIPWTFRMPDVMEIDLEMLEPDKKHRRYIAQNSPVRHEPAVYAWYVDHGMELLAAETLLGHIFPLKRPFTEVQRVFRKRLAERLRNLRRGLFIPPEKPSIPFSITSSDEILTEGARAMEGLNAD